MKNIWAADAAASPPTAPSIPSVGYPTDGNPVTAVPPTLPGAYWYHMITSELLAVIVAAGLTPDGADLNQLLDALDERYSNAVTSVNGETGDVVGLAPLASPALTGTPTINGSAALALASFTGSNQSLSASGYQKLPGGMILQWGKVTVNFGTDVTVTFPAAFPTACYAALPVMIGYPGAQIESGGTVSAAASASSFVIHHSWIGDGAGSPQDCDFYWLAVGK